MGCWNARSINQIDVRHDLFVLLDLAEDPVIDQHPDLVEQPAEPLQDWTTDLAEVLSHDDRTRRGA